MVVTRRVSVVAFKLYADMFLTYLIAALLFLEMADLTEIVFDRLQRNENDVVFCPESNFLVYTKMIYLFSGILQEDELTPL